ncbi:hypothetical protein FM106_13850 [Brachybacterium faecium]|nr:hypothetical protein FM106_13850 [Brachybacterium faecium]
MKRFHYDKGVVRDLLIFRLNISFIASSYPYCLELVMFSD